MRWLYILTVIGLLHPVRENDLNESKGLRFDGYYNTCDDAGQANVSAHRILVFSSDGGIFRSSTTLPPPLLDSAYFAGLSTSLIGHYTIVGDSVFACIPTWFYKRGLREELKLAKFVGYLKNSNTLVSWHMIKPYPDVSTRYNELFYHTRPQTLIFVKNHSVQALVSPESQVDCNRKLKQ